jgi:hypothetical protein
MITGATSLSIRKKDLDNQNSNAIGFNKLIFAHEATGGEAVIDITSLTTPSSMLNNGFTQPTALQLQNAKLFHHRKNLTVVSSSKGLLQDWVSYRVTSSNTITFEGFTADPGEIFLCTLDNNPSNGLQQVDAAPIVVTGTVLAGNQDINVGTPFEINKYPSQQLGSVTVFVDGMPQFRNAGNATANPAADGDYEEVDAGGGLGTIIRLNDTTGADRVWQVVSNGAIVNPPDDSRDATIESLAGQVDAMVPYLAVTAGVPESTFQGAPNNVNLKGFGDRVFKLETYRSVDSADTLANRTGVGIDKVLFSTAGGPGTYVLPLNPQTGQWVEIWDTDANWGTNTLTIDRNGELIEGAAADFTVSTDDVRLKIVYAGPARGWLIGTLS